MKKVTLEVPSNPSARWIENASVSEYVAHLLYKNGLTGADVSLGLGYKSPNILSTILSGRMRLPIGRIFDFAKALHADPYILREKVFKEAFPQYFAEEQRYLYTKRIYPLPRQIMELAKESGLTYGTLNEKETEILKEAFEKIKTLQREKAE
jgi:transcriptional regulator with XRE-family HTH domain